VSAALLSADGQPPCSSSSAASSEHAGDGRNLESNIDDGAVKARKSNVDSVVIRIPKFVVWSHPTLPVTHLAAVTAREEPEFADGTAYAKRAYIDELAGEYKREIKKNVNGMAGRAHHTHVFAQFQLDKNAVEIPFRRCLIKVMQL
jgi:hypothetical protein